MRLLTFEREGEALLGVRDGEAVIDLAAAAPELPRSWPEIFGNVLLSQVEAAVAGAGAAARLALADLTLLPPIPTPPKILCVGLNYKAHAAETGHDLPEYPIIFPRWPTSFVGHGQPIHCPPESYRYDYETELTAVIGKGGRRIPLENALDHVVGYSLANDGSLRDYQSKSSQWAMGKNFDRSGAWGPEIVTRDELPAGASGLHLQCWVNGEIRQDSRTDDLIFDIPRLVHEISVVMTLEPGDIILTGTPSGVVLGRNPRVWLKDGDLVEMEIEGIGRLANRVVLETV